QEADNLAQRVTTMPDPERAQGTQPSAAGQTGMVQAKSLASSVTPLIQRKDDPKKKDDQAKTAQRSILQRKDQPKKDDEKDKKAQRLTIQRADDHRKKDETKKAQTKRDHAPQMDDSDEEGVAQRQAKDDKKKKEDDHKSVQKAIQRQGDESAVGPEVAG